MIKSTRKILGQDVKDAVTKTMYLGTYFNGECSINLGDFQSQESRDLGLKNCIETTLQIKASDEVKVLLDEINERVYKIVMLQEDFKEGIEV